MATGYSNCFGEPEPTRYGDHRHPDLPWGYWLTSIGEVPGEPPLVDEEGREWGSVREAFWVTRFGLAEEYCWSTNDILDFLLSYMAIVDGRFVEKGEKARDIFMCDRHLGDFVEMFLKSTDLLKPNSRRLTLEGRAVLQMLIATRTRDDADENVGLDWIAATKGLAHSPERKAAAELVAHREEVATRMAHRFTTDSIDGVPVVKLIGLRITREIPVRSTLWTMSWPEGDRHARDSFYLWLVERIDRWDAWSEMVTEKGTRALTEHFMKLAFCDRFAAADAGNN
ncbi:MAG: hypothetical protein GW854_06730 [Erythrobacter sp.]|nr:hypothetical protein [Erythrobacter sp.]